MDVRSFEDKVEVITIKFKLTKLPGRKVYIDDYLTYVERRIQSEIRKKVRVSYDKLIYANKVLKWG